MPRPSRRPPAAAWAVAGLLLVLILSLGAPAPPAGGQLLPTLPTLPNAPTTQPPTTPPAAAPTTAAAPTQPVPTVAVATTPTTRPRPSTTSTSVGATTSSTAVPTTPAPVTVPPETTPETAPVALPPVEPASYSLLPLLITLTAFALAIAILVVPALVYRIRQGPAAMPSLPQAAEGARRLAGGAARVTKAAVARARLGVPANGPAGNGDAPGGREALPRPTMRPPTGPAAGQGSAGPATLPLRSTATPAQPARPAGRTRKPASTPPPVPPMTPAVTPTQPPGPRPARRTPKPAATTTPPVPAPGVGRPKRPPRPPRPAPPPEELWGSVPEGRVPADDPLAARPDGLRRARRPPRRKPKD